MAEWARRVSGAVSGRLWGNGKVADSEGSAEAKLHQRYELHEELGRGAYGRVHRATRRTDGAEVAVKIIKKGAKEKDSEKLTIEVDVLRRVQHKNLIRLYEVIDAPDTLYLVMQLCRGGELFDRIVERRKFSEEQARATIVSLLSALEHLHSSGVAHRDLKPENILLVEKGGDEIVLTDFGLSKMNSDEDTQMSTICGSPSYIAPEVLAMHGYGRSCDLWSAGVIAYILLSGYPPFHGSDNLSLFRKIKHGEWTFHSPWWDGIAPLAKDLISKLLVVDPARRLTAAQALAHPWLQSTASAAHVQEELIDQLAAHMAANLKLKKAMASTRMMVRLKLAVVRAFKSGPQADVDESADGGASAGERGAGGRKRRLSPARTAETETTIADDEALSGPPPDRFRASDGTASTTGTAGASCDERQRRRSRAVD
ncbi:kinase-like domain-containing protein [Pavlovales sp. CCMP2436]|nr:kinase-like domain-containing protein [Pavlovales sp. CCMP2436]